jgi:hypothetical protein
VLPAAEDPGAAERWPVRTRHAACGPDPANRGRQRKRVERLRLGRSVSPSQPWPYRPGSDLTVRMIGLAPGRGTALATPAGGSILDTDRMTCGSRPCRDPFRAAMREAMSAPFAGRAPDDHAQVGTLVQNGDDLGYEGGLTGPGSEGRLWSGCPTTHCAKTSRSLRSPPPGQTLPGAGGDPPDKVRSGAVCRSPDSM